MPAAYRVWQFLTALAARVAPGEQATLERHLGREQLALFRAMAVNDQRHALNVLYRLRAAGHDDPSLAQAALLHDVGKSCGRLRPLTRAAIVLLRLVSGRLVERLASPQGPAWRRALYVQAHHAALGADLAAAAGSAPAVVRLIREHECRGADQPTDGLARALREADDRS